MEKLNILWTTVNKDTVNNMISMYSVNALAHGWWKEINIIIWGGSAKLVAEDKEIQLAVVKMLEAGVSIEACKSCADNFGVTQKLEDLNIDVKYMGVPLTEYIKSGDKLLTL